MAASLMNVFPVHGSNQIELTTSRVHGFSPTLGYLQFVDSNLSASNSKFNGVQVCVSDQRALHGWNPIGTSKLSVKNAQTSVGISRAMRWWEKTPKPNMIDIKSAQELVDALLSAGDRLAIIDFYSPGCGGCKALHPKLCQLAESNPNTLFLKVNYEELKPVCQSLKVHVLPFFRFYRGAEGRLCSFSCTVATIKKFKDALAKHGTDRCSLGPTKGLDESELSILASKGYISIDWPLRSTSEETVEDLVPKKKIISVDKKEAIKEENMALVA